jgi:hypothetical protein
MIPIDLEDKIECLTAKRAPIIAALWQPKVELELNDTCGPRYHSDRKSIIDRVNSFLSIADQMGSRLTILPEFTTPTDTLIAICKGSIKLTIGTLLILPLEALSLDEYANLMDSILETGAVPINVKIAKQHSTANWVNVCAIVAITSGCIQVYLQPKRFASTEEAAGLCCGQESDYFVFHGRGIGLTVFVCADANERGIYGPQIDKTREIAKGSFFVHTQWNPKADYDIYDGFWREIVTTDPNRNILFSLNVATMSGVKQGDSIQKILIPMTRIARSGDAKRNTLYMKAQSFSAFKSVFREKWGMIFNLAYPHDCCHIIEIRRPFEMETDSVDTVKEFLISSKILTMKDNGFEECSKDVLSDRFTSYLKSKYVIEEELLERLIALSFEQIEVFLASCLQEEKYFWLGRDLLSRPFIWSVFFSDLGITNAFSRNSVDLFVTVLNKLNECRALGFQILPPCGTAVYPINLTSPSDGNYGWIFNCKGLSDVAIAEQVSRFLSDVTALPQGRTITLFPTNCSSNFRAETFELNVRQTALCISDPKNAFNGNLDIRIPDSNPNIRVNPL